MASRRRIYIVPTRFGFMFLGGTLVVLMVGAIYANNLVNLLSFFMFSLTFVTMVQTHNNLKDIALETLIADSGFAGGERILTGIVKNTSAEPRFKIELHERRARPLAFYENVHPVAPGSTQKLRSSYRCERRGRYSVREVTVSTIYPVGLFYAWIYAKCDSPYFIYPEPKGTRPLPAGFTGAAESGSQAGLGGEDYREHRLYQRGDSSKHIDWKAFARGRPLLVKSFNDGAPQPLLIDWFALESLGTEERLSQLAAWIEEASRRRLPFALRFPGLELTAGHGPGHARRCLEALAVFEDKASPKGDRHESGRKALG